MGQQTLFKVRDKRKRDWFWMDNKYLNGYAKVFGATGTAIYLDLCRHCDEDQKCFPSEKTIGEELNITDRTVRKYLKLFEKYRLIEITKERSTKGKWLNNTYWLLDRSEWLSPEEIVSSGLPKGNKKQTHRKLTTAPEETDNSLTISIKKNTNYNNRVIIKKIGNERLEIPVGDPPPGTGEKPDLEGLKKFRQMKAPLLKKLSMANNKERTEIQEEIAPLIRNQKLYGNK